MIAATYLVKGDAAETLRLALGTECAIAEVQPFALEVLVRVDVHSGSYAKAARAHTVSRSIASSARWAA